MSPKGQYNNIIDNNINKEKIDRLFNYIIDKEKEIPKEFINVDFNEINVALRRFDMSYPKPILDIMSEENLESVKNITYIIGNLRSFLEKIQTLKTLDNTALRKIYRK